MTVYPNPVEASATITYTLPYDGHVTLQVYNSIGVPVATLVDEEKTSGSYTLENDFSSYPNGLYLAKIKLGHAKTEKVHTVRFIVTR